MTWLSAAHKFVRGNLGVRWFRVVAKMVLKAVCVLKGAGETSGTVYFEQEVIFWSFVIERQHTFILRLHLGARLSAKGANVTWASLQGGL